MRLVDYAQRHRVAAGAVAGLVVGTVLGLAQPIRASAPDADELAAWTPYDAAALARYDEVLFARIRDRPVWSGSASAPGAAGAPARVQWRLAAIADGPRPVALVFPEGSASAVRIMAGDALPDAGKVIEVTARSIRFERAGCEFERALYSEVDQTAPGCAARQ